MIKYFYYFYYGYQVYHYSYFIGYAFSVGKFMYDHIPDKNSDFIEDDWVDMLDEC
jgi:hypothetical protein